MLIFLFFACSNDVQEKIVPQIKQNKISANQWFNLFQLAQLTNALNPYYPEVLDSKTLDSLKIKKATITIEENLSDNTTKSITKYDFQFRDGMVFKYMETVFFDAKMRWKRSFFYYKPADGLRYPISHNYKQYSPIFSLMGLGNEIFINTDIPLLKSAQISANLLRVKIWKDKNVEVHFYAKSDPIELNADSLKVGTFVHLGSPTKILRTAVKLPYNLWLTTFSVQVDEKTKQPIRSQKHKGQINCHSNFIYNQKGLFTARIDAIKFHGILLRTSKLVAKYDTLGHPKTLTFTQYPTDGEPFIAKQIHFDWR